MVGPSRLAPLAGLRFAAALGVLLFHYGAVLVDGGPAWAAHLVLGGHAWVSLFFVLSGFVLARAHPAPMGPAERRSFWADRTARLYPTYLLAFALYAPFALERWEGTGAGGGLRAAAVAVATLLLAQAWAAPIARVWNPPGWSTSAFAFFYALFPFASSRLSRLSRGGLAAATAGAWFAALALPLLCLALRPAEANAAMDVGLREPSWLEVVKFHPVARAPEFLAGVALGLLQARGLRLGRLAPLAAIAGLCGSALAIASGLLPPLALHNGVLLPLHALALLGLAEGGGIAGRVLGWRPLRPLGDASFALYILQDPLWRAAKALSPWADAPAPAAFVVAFAAGAVAVALAVSRVIEPGARRALRARLAAPRGATLTAGSWRSRPRTG